MNKSSLIFIVVAALLIGGLLGLGLSSQAPGLSDGVASTSTQAPEILKSETVAKAASPLQYRLYDPKSVEVRSDEFGRAEPHAVGENFMPGKKAFKLEKKNISLPLDGSVEYKAVMDEGDSLVYQWKVKKGEVYFDFHGHPYTEETEFFNRYLEGESASDSGSIVAAFTGHHGWYWLNIADHPIEIELEVVGFFDRIDIIATE